MRVFPPVIKFLLIANVAIFFVTNFAAGITFGGIGIRDLAIEWFALWPFENGFWPWQVISYQYLHGGIGHIFFNMFALWMFGMELEQVWGSKRFALYYTLSGIAAAVVHMIVTPLFGGGIAPTIGASGSVMGILLAFGLMFPTRPVMMFPIFFPIPARIFVLLYAGFDLVMGLAGTGDGVAHFAHLGGALGGFLLLRFGEPLLSWLENSKQPGGFTQGFGQRGSVIDVEYRDVNPRSTRFDRESAVRYDYREEKPPTPETPTRFQIDGQGITQERIDEILDKISVGGYHSLTEAEKNILYQVSKQL